MSTPAATVRVLVADDHAIVRRGLRALLDAEADIEVVGEAETGAEAVELAISLDVDLVILDVAMPRMTGLQAVRELARRRSDIRTIVLSMYDRHEYLAEAAAAGASGYVLKRGADRDIVGAVRRAARGESPGWPARTAPRGASASAALTPREEQVLKLIAEGWSSGDIARALFISVNTVERHRENMRVKLGLHDRVELTRYAIRAGLVEP